MDFLSRENSRVNSFFISWRITWERGDQSLKTVKKDLEVRVDPQTNAKADTRSANGKNSKAKAATALR